MSGRLALKSTLQKIWHAPDDIRIMDPLPQMHRRGIIIGFLLVTLGVILPSTENTSALSPRSHEGQLDLEPQQSGSSSGASTFPDNDADQVAPVTPEVVQDEEQTQQAQALSLFQNSQGISQRWRAYRLEPGKTLAQLFRDNNLPATDVYAMSKVEGAGRPLSTLHAGQVINIRQNASNVVTGLMFDSAKGQQILFTRQSNGRFIRVR